VTKAPEVKSLSPSKEAFEKDEKRVHIETAIWKSNLKPPALNPVEFG